MTFFSQGVLNFPDILFHSQDSEGNLLVLTVIQTIIWNAPFNDVDVLPSGSYLYYNRNIVIVAGLAVVTVHGVAIPATSPVYPDVNSRSCGV